MRQPTTLDPTDLKILDLLQRNGRMDVAHIAAKVYRSQSTTHYRMNRLVSGGYIRRFAAILDRELLGLPVMMILQVRLRDHSADALKEFAAYAKALPEVQVVLQLSGEADFLLQIAAVSPAGYEDFLEEKICRLPMVQQVQSSLVLREYKQDQAIALNVL